MFRAEEEFGLTPPKIAAIFRRDVRTVTEKMKKVREEMRKGQQAPPREIGKAAQLQIEFDPRRLSELGPIGYSDSALIRKFARVSVRNVGEATALQSWGILRILAPKDILNMYPRDMKLHWVDTPYGLETDSAQPVDIQVDPSKLLDVAFSQPTKEEVQKAKELAFGQSLTSGHPYSVVVGSMNLPGWEEPIPNKGCWTATNIALAKPLVTVPGYMPPGRYVVSIRVGCNNGQGDEKCFEIISPLKWQDLQMVPVSCTQNL